MNTRRGFALGVDTGGTYTDAVVYEEATRTVVAKAKAPTTHDDLALGVRQAIDQALAAAETDPGAIQLVALSTTLATNALVEGKGRPAALVSIGFDHDSFSRPDMVEAIGSDPLIMVSGGHSSHGEPIAPLDVDELVRKVDAVAGQVEAFAVTAQFATRNPSQELEARDLIRARTGRPVTCSHVLSSSLGGPRRGITALLNARLISLIDELVTTTGHILEVRGISAPMMVVRGNGSLVSTEFVAQRPVETILSGPAASLVGAAHLADCHNAVISDIGGTTTDIAVLHDGVPPFDADGAMVGGHRTMVEAVSMQTHGLGGDSEITVPERAEGCVLVVGPRRVVPLSLMAVDYRSLMLSVLERQIAAEVPGVFDGMFVEPTVRAGRVVVDRTEQQLLDQLNDGLVPVDSVVRSSVQERALRRLVSRSVVRLSAFTPTDASHVLGAQTTHDPTAAQLGAELFSRRRDRYGRAIAESGREISEKVVDALVRRSAEALLAAALRADGLDPVTVSPALVDAALNRSTTATRLDLGVRFPVIGLGASAATYYPAIGDLLGAPVVVPPDADVANAVGAAVGEVRVRHEVQVTAPRRGVYRVHGPGDPETAWERDDARLLAEQRATEVISVMAREAGTSEFEVEVVWEETIVEVGGRPMFVEGIARATASGRPDIR